MEVEVFRTEKFSILYKLPPDTNTIVCVGGRGGMKTYEVSKFVAYSATIQKKKCVILRDEKALIKESILSEVWARYDTANETGLLSPHFIKNENELKDKSNGNTLVYTKGFRASNNDKKANLKGSAGVDIAIVEEAEDIRDVEKYNTFVDSLRKQGCLIIIMLNTPDINHWLIKRLFNINLIEDGYFNITPKQIPGFVCIQTSFRDNPFLPAHIISNYEGYGNPAHHLYNYHYYMTAIQGFASTGRKGQIYTKVKPISFDAYMKLPYKEYYGQDFGTASPAALVGVKFEANTAYMRLINYKPMPVLELAKLYSTLKFNNSDRIVCDYAEPKSIGKLANGFNELSSHEYMTYPELSSGFYAVPCPTKDISARISLMSGMQLCAVETHTELWDEINNYVYAVDKNGNYTDEPIDAFNHALDAAAYIITDQRGDQNLRAY